MALCPSQICSASAFVHIPGENILHDLSSRFRRLLEACNNHGLVPNEELWRRRTCTGVESGITHIPCQCESWLTMHVTWAVMSFALLQSEDGTVDERALRNVRKTDESFDKAWNCLRELYVALF
jgi:hypothetical protein